MRAAATLITLAVGLVQLAQANSFMMYNDTDPDCKSTPFKKLGDDELMSDECIAVDEGTVSAISHSNAWTDLGFLYGYNTSDCSSQMLGKLPTSESKCWAIDDFNGEGWGQTVRGILLVLDGMKKN